jgi:hypothetical protein
MLMGRFKPGDTLRQVNAKVDDVTRRATQVDLMAALCEE